MDLVKKLGWAEVLTVPPLDTAENMLHGRRIVEPYEGAAANAARHMPWQLPGRTLRTTSQSALPEPEEHEAGDVESEACELLRSQGSCLAVLCPSLLQMPLRFVHLPELLPAGS